ncbi:acyl-CoA dehydrogenase family protein [Kitasatospora sp. NPDC053057]|uniref:acyl-CoA dehydrogenase family protein n=1 Tax=Kitasatospora sp. NPDC053057 TaxID=3364062 RepID=UPI0037C884C1
MNAQVPRWPAGVAGALAAAMDTAAAAGGPFSGRRTAELDAAEAFPDQECALLDAAGFPRAYVPARLGGAPGGLPELVDALRTVAARDLTAAVAHGKTFLGSVSTWVAGTEEQQRALAELVLDEHAVAAWGLTEPGIGSDLLAGSLTAVPDPDGGWRLTGEKWPINNATRGRLVCVLARTGPDGGPRGFSLFLVDKSTLWDGAWQPLPKEPTHGIRGADISGIRLNDAPVPADALIGGVGDGLGIVLNALQLTRTMCVALSLGAGEHALRLATGFAAGRELYGTRLLLLPLARRTLGRAAAALALADAATLLAARCAHGLTGEMSTVSAAVKAGVPWIVQQVVDDLAELLGARSFLTDHHADGTFQKLERDHRIVAVFDGSTAVNRSLLISQFPLLARLIGTGRHDAAGLAAVTGQAPLPDLDPRSLRLVSRTGCSVVQAVPDAAGRVADLAAAGVLPEHAARLATLLAAQTRALADAMAELSPSGGNAPAAAFAVARRFELCFAGGAVLHLLAAAGGPERAVTLTAALERCLELLVPGRRAPADAYEPLVPSPAHPVEEPVR